eukprot:tig00021493_g21885.t1
MSTQQAALFVCPASGPSRTSAASASQEWGPAVTASSSCIQRPVAANHSGLSPSAPNAHSRSTARGLSHRRFHHTAGNDAGTCRSAPVSVGVSPAVTTVRACGGGLAVEAIPQQNGRVMLVVKPCLRCLARGRLDCECEHLESEFAGGGGGRTSFSFGGGSGGGVVCAFLNAKTFSNARRMFSSWLWYDKRSGDGISRTKLGGILAALAAASYFVQLPFKSFVILAAGIFCAMLYRAFPDEAKIVSSVVVRRPASQVMRHLTHPRPYRSPALPAVLAGAKAGLLPECSSLPQYISQRALAAVTSASASLHPSSSSSNGNGAAASSAAPSMAVSIPISVPSSSSAAEAAAASVAAMPRATSPAPTNLDAVLAGATQAPCGPGAELGEELRADGVVRHALWRVTGLQENQLSMELIDRDELAGWLRGEGTTTFDLVEQPDGTTLVTRTTVVRQGYKIARFVEKATWRRFLHLASHASLDELRATVETCTTGCC